MNRSDLVREVAAQTGLAPKDVRLMLDAVTRVISQELAQHRSVSIAKFGVFTVIKRQARPAHGIATQAGAQIPESLQPKFKPSPHLKEQIKP